MYIESSILGISLEDWKYKPENTLTLNDASYKEFYRTIFNREPSFLKFQIMKAVIKEFIRDYCELAAVNFRNHPIYERWRIRFRYKQKFGKVLNEKEQIQTLFRIYNNQELTEEESDYKRKLMHHQMDLVEETLLNDKKDYLDFLLNLS